MSLLRGLKVTIDNHFNRSIVEGYSQIIIQLITKILHGEHPLEISPSWRLTGLLEDLGSLLSPNLTIIPSHVKREANKVPDFLENEGVDTKMEHIHWKAQNSPCMDLLKRFRDLANRDLLTLDRVTCHPLNPPGTDPSLAINEAG